MKISMVNLAAMSVSFKRLGEAIDKACAVASKIVQSWAIRAGFRHPVRSIQVALDYPKPGPRRSRFTGIAALRRNARRERNRRRTT